MLGFHPVHRVAQSYLGSLWIALDKREGDPGKTVLLRRVQLPSDTPSEARQHIAMAGRDAMQLRHPNLLPVLDVLEQGDDLGLVHEHVEGEPLRSLQSWANLRGTSFPVSVSLRIISDLLSAVTALHEAAGATSVSPYGGLSPDSVLVTRSGATQLCDPLVASCASLLDGIGFNTAKLAYAAPEQVNAVAPLTPASDVFTCGALLWELLAARRLLSGSRAALERKLMEHNLPSLASNLRSDQQVSPALVELVGRALSGDAAKRPASAAALQAELASCGHELASPEQVAQFVGKLSGQRFDRRSAAVRSKSVPELDAASLEWPVEVPSGTAGPTSRRAPRPGAGASGGLARAKPARVQAEPSPAAQAGPSSLLDSSPSPSEQAQSEPTLSSQMAPVSSQTQQNAVPSAPLQSSQASTERSDELPASPAASTPSRWLPPAKLGASARKAAPGAPGAQGAAPSTARTSEAGPATPGAGGATRKDLPAFLEAPAAIESAVAEASPESFAIDDDFPTETGLGLDDDGDLTVREPTPEGWLEQKPEAGGAPATAPGVGFPEPLLRGMPPQSAADVGGRTFVGVGRPGHPALAASPPFARMTPEPFPAPPARPPSPFDPPAAPGAAGATLAGVPPAPRPFAGGSSAAGATLLGMPPAAMPPLGMPPAAMPPGEPSGAAVRPPSPFDPPRAAPTAPFAPPAAAARPPSPFDPPAGAPPSPIEPPSEQPTSSSPSASPYSRTATSVAPPASGAPGRGTLPPGIASLRGYEPRFAELPGELLPRISPSARVSRPRSGWARALGLGSGGSGRTRTVLAGAAACVALAAAVLLVLLLRRSDADGDAQLSVEPSAAVQRPAESAPSEPGAAIAPGGAEAAPPAAAAADAGAAQPDGEPDTSAASAMADAPVGVNAPRLSDAQLSQLFALEQHENVPSCPERAASSSKSAKAKRNAAKEAKEAARLLKVARTELKRKKVNPEKAHGYLCRATTHDPSNWQAQQALAEVSLQLGNPAQAQAAAEKALARKPEDVTLLGLLGDALALTGDLPGSRRAWLRSARGQGPETERMRALAGTYRKLAERVARSSSYPLACALYRRALVLTEGSYAPSIGLAEALRGLGQPRAALAWAERAAHAFPKDARVQLTYGDILYENGQKQEAKAAWKAARKAQPSNALAARRLARGKP